VLLRKIQIRHQSGLRSALGGHLGAKLPVVAGKCKRCRQRAKDRICGMLSTQLPNRGALGQRSWTEDLARAALVVFLRACKRNWGGTSRVTTIHVQEAKRLILK
jgi:hypothetical protein